MLNKTMKRGLCSVLAASMLLGSGLVSVAAEEKPTVTLMLEIGGYTPLVKVVEMAKEKFPEYNIISKEWSIDGVKKAIKTTIAADGEESIDIAFFSSTGILGFAETGLLTDLTPYLDEDAEWKESFQEGALNSCTIDGAYYGVPWQSAYLVMVANKDIFDELGIEIKDDWTYDELIEVCETLKENGYFAFGVNTGNSSWLIRQSYLNGFETEEEVTAFNNGEISLYDEKVVEAFDRVKALYENNYCYPGEGAIAATDDEIKVGVANGKVALAATTNSGVGTLVADTGLENYQVVNFPSFSNYLTANLLGSPDVYIVPKNVNNIEATMDVLKYITGEEVLTEMANLGTVVTLKEVNAEDPNYAEYSKDMDRLHMQDFANLSDEISDYISSGAAVTTYLYEGESALDELEKMRETAIENK